MIELPNPMQIRLALRRTLRPTSKLGKTTLWFGGLAVGLQLWKWIAHSRSGSMLSVWAALVTYVFVVCLMVRGLRWARQKLMWRLRNRLIVTYVFIGVIPVVLLISMVLLAGYLFAGQFATYIALSDLDSELQHLTAVNNALAEQFRTLTQSGKLTPQLAAEIANSSDESLRQRTLTVLEGDNGFVIEPGGKITIVQLKLPQTARGSINRFVMDHGRLHLRTVRRVEAGSRHMIILSSLPITSELLQRAAHVGSVDLYLPDQDMDVDKPASLSSGNATPTTESTESFAAPKSLAGRSATSAPQNIAAGRVAPAATRFDPEFRWWTPFNIVDWESGKELTGVIVVGTRPSMLYNVLFGNLNTKAGIFIQVLLGIALFFGLIELIALFIGVRLTRSVTKSVAELYTATQHVNRGDLSHRIEVKSRDQMAALEGSFNSMTASLARLIAEQKEKQRLEGELAIAHEVQELLFPRQISELSTLEVHGVCRPARTVSGDYYDFIPLHADRMVLAVGDISGKGISAALLMATVHAFVRAYSLEPELALAAVATAGGARTGDLQLYYRGNGDRDNRLSPGMLMATLNYQLYRSTPPEKYATMFLANYDAGARMLTYSNAGHLPPYVVGGDGSVTQLDTSGTVVGLFDSMSYEESRIPMRPGDVFVAFSDGVTEPENEFGEFGESRLVDLIRLHRDQPLSRISDVVTGAVADWIGGNEQPDDVTLVLARAR
ncbi:MAG TPA: SpoIIE family protein phosphatase [Candidatus Limnocylindrales bacterium]|nr:SpoIIE family protein phosphatase [Candidatus Limnocylindrales bacterium]